ncbi:hypothetical protein BpHYR1_011864 [Brachionus plicatilis]|uniref:Uncharacterized protein n=1 Tax=Brachionus plicatilis TaxID=10195 RepID=A0A3M7SYU8_BRAPC|nr:hypothetical protein BpHYR1_011864 [Brachionus plicatilis]
MNLKTLTFTNPLKHSEKNRMRNFKNTQEIDLEEVEEYDSSKGEIVSDFDIKIVDKNIPRYSCACHRTNLAVRHAISLNAIGDNLKILNSSNNHVRKSIQQNKVFSSKKSRPGIDNKTRCSSTHLLLESVKRAYD